MNIEIQTGSCTSSTQKQIPFDISMILLPYCCHHCRDKIDKNMNKKYIGIIISFLLVPFWIRLMN